VPDHTPPPNGGQLLASLDPRDRLRAGRTRRRPTFRQKDLQRALKAAQDAGLKVTKFELDPISGKISISTADPNEPATEQSIIETWMANRVRAS
jgi:hypothetical protein